MVEYILVMLRVTLLSFIVASIACLQCLNKNGQPVDWWIVLKVPPKIGSNAYGYYDSTQQSNSFTYQKDPIDEGVTALTNTFQLFNSQNFNRVAWNDEKPSGATSSSSAHSKGLIAFDLANQKGFILSHSIPQYPAFVNGQLISIIGPSQQIYGQHLSCFSLSLEELELIASNLLITRPNVYQAAVQKIKATQNLYELANKNFITSGDVFYNLKAETTYGYSMMSIFKNGKLNGSIFEDGLTYYLGSKQLIAQTWGRPLQPAWCNQSYQVKNVLTIEFAGLTWNEADDHSKWVLTQDFACFGDMNRMKSQWTRGGAFYCLVDRGLITALKSLVAQYDSCSQKVKNLSLRQQ